MQLFNGDNFYSLENPFSQCINLDNIPPALSKICRYSGHTKFFYSVAQHSLLCLDIAKEASNDYDLHLAILFHDAHECLTGFGDVISGHKDWRIKKTESTIDEILAKELEIDVRYFKHPLIKNIDHLILKLEHQQLLTNVPKSLQNLEDINYVITEQHYLDIEKKFRTAWKDLECCH